MTILTAETAVISVAIAVAAWFAFGAIRLQRAVATREIYLNNFEAACEDEVVPLRKLASLQEVLRRGPKASLYKGLAIANNRLPRSGARIGRALKRSFAGSLCNELVLWLPTRNSEEPLSGSCSGANCAKPGFEVRQQSLPRSGGVCRDLGGGTFRAPRIGSSPAFTA